jgi:pimeloyl-ACP methyl ester carboxylesterase
MASITRRGFDIGFRFAVERDTPRRVPQQFVDRWYGDYDWRTRRAILRLYRATSDPSGLGYDLARVLRLLDRPALVIWGRHDRYLPLWMAERQREAFPSARVVVLDDSGHFPFADDPAGVQNALLPFVRQQLAG